MGKKNKKKSQIKLIIRLLTALGMFLTGLASFIQALK